MCACACVFASCILLLLILCIAQSDVRHLKLFAHKARSRYSKVKKLKFICQSNESQSIKDLRVVWKIARLPQTVHTNITEMFSWKRNRAAHIRSRTHKLRILTIEIFLFHSLVLCCTNKRTSLQYTKQTDTRSTRQFAGVFYVLFSKKCSECFRQLTRPLQSCAFSSASLIPFRRISSIVWRNASSSWLRDARNNVVTSGNLSIFILIDFFVAQIKCRFSHSHSLFPLLALENHTGNGKTKLIENILSKKRRKQRKKQFINWKVSSCLLASIRCSNFKPFLRAYNDWERNIVVAIEIEK